MDHVWTRLKSLMNESMIVKVSLVKSFHLLLYYYKIDLAFMMNVCIFLALKSTLGRRLGTGFKDL